MDIVITIPKSTSWKVYKVELEHAEKGGVLNYKVRSFPKNTNVGERCYVVHDGYVKGWMKIVGYIEKEFTCTVTGRKWKGKFIERAGKFHYLDEPLPMKGFRGFRNIVFNRPNDKNIMIGKAEQEDLWKKTSTSPK